MKVFLIGAVAALSLGGAAFAQDARHGPRAADTDGDSRVSRAEFIAAALQRFDEGDANRDGVIAAEEVMARREARRDERREHVFTALDANSDGMISRAEFDARAESRGEGAEGGGRGGRGGRHRWGGRGGGFEADGVTRAEAETRAGARFDRMDRNDDGFLSAEDRQGRAGGRRGRPAE